MSRCGKKDLVDTEDQKAKIQAQGPSIVEAAHHKANLRCTQYS